MFAEVIVDISLEKLDRIFQYIIPEVLVEQAVPGAQVKVPFGNGNRIVDGFIVSLSEKADYPVERMKPIAEIPRKAVVMESQLIALAYWIKKHYGGTMNDALRTVLPVKRTVKAVEKRYLHRLASEEQFIQFQKDCEKKHRTAQGRLAAALLEKDRWELQELKKTYGITMPVIHALEDRKLVSITSDQIYRNPRTWNVDADQKQQPVTLNEEQSNAVSDIMRAYESGVRTPWLLHGVTGSGKTEVYMELIRRMMLLGKQCIVLIPEISLTFQTVQRFKRQFGNKVSFLHSRLSQGERYDQYIRAKQGEISVMIGPRSALFTPFSRLGLIIVDEEQENSYKSESVPRYHAREAAIYRSTLCDGMVVLGSATPSVETFYHVQKGDYAIAHLTKRAVLHAVLPKVHVADMRKELEEGNRSIFSRSLKILIQDRLSKKQQIMLFLNRRGFAGFVSCRSCGQAMKCPHCDVSLTFHQKRKGDRGTLVCHYCGYETEMVMRCPDCGSPYVGTFGIGTQKVEQYLAKEFPEARILRMDADTTRGKEGHEKILLAFQKHEADILVGTQMIVKGHDFPNVTLVGAIAADLSLNGSDYTAAEKTYQLLAQAAGRAGRGSIPGDVVIQTYQPNHYSICAAAANDYQSFYENEISFRTMAGYPPVQHLLAVFVSGGDESAVTGCARAAADFLKRDRDIQVLGPMKASLYRANDQYRNVIYVRNTDPERLILLKDGLEEWMKEQMAYREISVTYDFDPCHSY
ncbi:MAG: primosomal protein N' [Clostridiales bacterium]|nr:primosomal protein N' [Clostridiales bacterium]